MCSTLSEKLQRCLQRLRAHVKHGAEPERIDEELVRIARDIDELPADEQRQIREAVQELEIDDD